MTNSIYNQARYLLATAGLDWRAVDLGLVAWGGTPTFVPTENTLADMTAGGASLIATSLAITQKSVSADGTAQTNPVVLPMVPIGIPVTHLTMVQIQSPAQNSKLILFIDEAEGLPFTPNGLDMVVQPDWLLNRGWFRP